MILRRSTSGILCGCKAAVSEGKGLGGPEGERGRAASLPPPDKRVREGDSHPTGGFGSERDAHFP